MPAVSSIEPVRTPFAPDSNASTTISATVPIEYQNSARSTRSSGSRCANELPIIRTMVSRIAPIAPTEAASVGVATPAMIEPSTAMIRSR